MQSLLFETHTIWFLVGSLVAVLPLLFFWLFVYKMESAFNIDIERFINEIHLRPAIWDMRTSEYADKIKKKGAWEELTYLYVQENDSEERKKIIGGLLQKKWKNIRDRYSREIAEQKGKSGQARKGKAPYVHANQLSFLRDVLKSRKTESSLDDESQAENVSIITPETPDDNTPKIGKKRKAVSMESKLMDAIDSHNTRQREKAANQRDNEDDDKLFLLSLLPTIKTIPPHLKFAVRMDIMQTINKYLTGPPTEPTRQPLPTFSQTLDQQRGFDYPFSSVQHHSHSQESQADFVELQPRRQCSELQPGSSGLQRNVFTPLPSPIESVSSQDSDNISLF